MDNREKIKKFVESEIKLKGYPPSIREICSEVGLKSTSSVQYHLKKLEEDGLIKRVRSKSRSIQPTSHYPNDSISIPILGEISAGHPMLAEEYSIGTLNIPNKYRSENNIFALKVSGDSMVDAGIHDDDLVVVEKTIKYTNNDIVAVMSNGEATVKYFKTIDNTPYLVPANKRYRKTKISDEHQIIGKVICLFRDI